MLEGVRRIGEFHPVPEAEIVALEKDIGTALPASFRNFLLEIGGCWYCSVITTYVPWVIRERIGFFDYNVEHKFYPWQNPDVLPLEKLVNCICIAGTLDGDSIVFLPDDLNKYFILPRHKETVYSFNGSYESLIEWIVYGGQLYDWHTNDEQDLDDVPNWEEFEDPRDGAYVEGFSYSNQN